MIKCSVISSTTNLSDQFRWTNSVHPTLDRFRDIIIIDHINHKYSVMILSMTSVRVLCFGSAFYSCDEKKRETRLFSSILRAKIFWYETCRYWVFIYPKFSWLSLNIERFPFLMQSENRFSSHVTKRHFQESASDPWIAFQNQMTFKSIVSSGWSYNWRSRTSIVSFLCLRDAHGRLLDLWNLVRVYRESVWSSSDSNIGLFVRFVQRLLTFHPRLSHERM